MMCDTITFLGPRCSYHHIAAQKFVGKMVFNNVPELVSVSSFEDVFRSVHSTNIGIIATNNTTTGNVSNHLSRVQNNYNLISYLQLKIHHTLLIHPDTALEKITKIIIHPQVELQCNMFLDTQPWLRQQTSSTSQGAEIITTNNLLDTATIGNLQIAEHYTLKHIDISVMNSIHNTTWFAVFSKKL